MSLIFDWQAQIIPPQLNDSAWISEKPQPAASSQYAFFFFFDSAHADFLFIACVKVTDTVLFGLHLGYEAQLC